MDTVPTPPRLSLREAGQSGVKSGNLKGCRRGTIFPLGGVPSSGVVSWDWMIVPKVLKNKNNGLVLVSLNSGCV
jgi:hypothetical protein